MISPLPWELDEENPSIIRDAEGEIIAQDYTFLYDDDFEAICKLTKNREKDQNGKS